MRKALPSSRPKPLNDTERTLLLRLKNCKHLIEEWERDLDSDIARKGKSPAAAAQERTNRLTCRLEWTAVALAKQLHTKRLTYGLAALAAMESFEADLEYMLRSTRDTPRAVEFTFLGGHALAYRFELANPTGDGVPRTLFVSIRLTGRSNPHRDRWRGPWAMFNAATRVMEHVSGVTHPRKDTGRQKRGPLWIAPKHPSLELLKALHEHLGEFEFYARHDRELGLEYAFREWKVSTKCQRP